MSLQPDRESNEPPITQTVELGEYRDISETTQGDNSAPNYSLVHSTFNMRNYSMDESLTREYLIADTNWATSSATGSQLANVSFPRALFDEPYIADKIKDFVYFRAGVKLTIRLTCSRQMYGAILVAYTPTGYLNPVFSDALVYTETNEKLFHMSGYDHTLITAASNSTGVLNIPFINPNRALNLSPVEPDAIARVNVMVASPLRSIDGAVTSARVQLFASFVNPELMLPNKYDPSFVTESTGEARAKSRQGVVSSDLISKASEALSMESQNPGPYTRIFRGVANVASAAASISELIGLSKPTTLQTTAINKINPYSDMANGEGIDCSMKLSCNPECSVSTDPGIAGVPEDQMLLSSIVGTPQMVHNMVKNRSDVGVPFSLCTNQPGSFRDYLNVVSKNFMFSSGTVKVKLYFVASIFHTVRVMLSYSKGGVVPADSWRDCYHKEVEIQGDTEVEISLPYVDETFASDINVPNVYCTLACQILSWSDPVTDDSLPINILIYRSGGEDFRFFGHREMGYTSNFVVESNPRADFAKEFHSLSPDIKHYGTKNVVAGEEITSLRQLVHRYHAVSSVGNSFQPIVYNREFGVEHYFWNFLYNRGSIRTKLITRPGNGTRLAYVEDGSNHYMGLVGSSEVNPVMEMEVPYYDSMAFRPNRVGAFPVTVNTSAARPYNAVSNQYLCNACGDDFSLLYLVPAPPGSFSLPTGSTVGQHGLIRYSDWVDYDVVP